MKMTINIGHMRPEDILPELESIKYTFASRLNMGEYIALSSIITALEEGDEVIED